MLYKQSRVKKLKMTMMKRRRIGPLVGLSGLAVALMASPACAFTTTPQALLINQAGRMQHFNSLRVAAEDETTTKTEEERSIDDSAWDNPEAMKVVGLKRPTSAAAAPVEEPPSALQEQKNRNIAVAIVSIVLAIGNFFWQYSHPVTSVQLLTSMQQASAPVTLIGTNGKPSVVDFWAPWCENCKLSAPTLHKVEEEYGDKVNFVMINGDQSQAWPYIEAFGVDAIPHLALVSADGDVMTALIGPTPKSVLEADLDVMLKNAKAKDEQQPLPYVMMDVFANKPERRRVHFDEE